jgi:spore maturation protein A
MLNIIWGMMLIISALCALVNHRLELLSDAVLKSVEHSFFFVLKIGGMMVFWMGLVRIAEKSGLVFLLGRALRPLLGFLFPNIPKESSAFGDITLNLAANMLGLANAATPFGIRAMEALQDLNDDKERASDAMCMLVCINNSSVQLIPFTAIAILSQAGGHSPTNIILTSVLATSVSTTVAIILVKMFTRFSRRKAV